MRRGMHAVLECARTTQKDRFEAGSAGVTWQISSKTLEQDRILFVHRSFRPRGCGSGSPAKLNETEWKSVPLPTRPCRDSHAICLGAQLNALDFSARHGCANGIGFPEPVRYCRVSVAQAALGRLG